ncbi:CMTR2 family protein [Megaselia abdita]
MEILNAKCLHYKKYAKAIYLENSENFNNSYEFQDFVELRDNLFSAGDELFENTSSEEFQKITRKFSPYAILMNQSNKQKFELFYKPWCKIYEILERFPLVTPSNGRLNSLHLEESIGAMVSGLNHFIKTKHPKIDWNWKATNPNPYYEDCCDSPLIDYCPAMDYLLHFTLDNWIMGEDFTGNFQNAKNINHLINECNKMGKISLITSDGSFCTYLDQRGKEDSLYVLQYSELAAALSILDFGGNFVWKVFHMFNSNNISLLFLLNLAFKKVSLFKPFTCPSDSSEIYVICQNFEKKTTDLEKLVKKMVENVGKKQPIFPKAFVPMGFLKEHLDFMEILTTTKIEAVRNFINLGNSPREMNAKLQLTNAKKAAEKFMRSYNLYPLFHEDRLTPFNNKKNAFGSINAHYDMTEFAATVDEINYFGNLTETQQKEMLSKKLRRLAGLCQLLNQSLPKLRIMDLVVVQGKPVKNVTRSMLVSPVILKLAGLIQLHQERSLLEISGLTVLCVLNRNTVNFEFSCNFGCSEKNFLFDVLDEFIRRKPSRILFKNYFFITHFAASVLAVLASFYESSFIQNCDIILEEFRDNYQLFRLLDETIQTYDSKRVFSLLDPTKIQRTDFSLKLVQFNNSVMVNHMTSYVGH